MSLVYCCEVCDLPCPRWSLERRGDAVASWACDEHLPAVLAGLLREHGVTEVIVRSRGAS